MLLLQMGRWVEIRRAQLQKLQGVVKARTRVLSEARRLASPASRSFRAECV